MRMNKNKNNINYKKSSNLNYYSKRLNHRNTSNEKHYGNSRLFFLLVWMFVLGLTLVTTSYAWFTSNRISTIWLMEVKVAAQNGIEISADAIKWGAEISVEELLNAPETYPNSINQLPTILEPVSTVGTVQNGLINMYYGKVENSYQNSSKFTLRTNKIEEKSGYGNMFDGKFLAFDLFLKVTTPTELYITNESGVTYSGEASAGIENSMRFAFVIEGNVPTETSSNVSQNLKTSDRSNVYIWEPNYDIHTEAALDHARDVYNLNLNSPSSLVPYEGVKAIISKADNVTTDTANKHNFPNFFDNVRVDYSSKVDFTDYIKVFSLEPGITKIRTYVWIEGQDVDCENNAAVGGMNLNLQFSTNPS